LETGFAVCLGILWLAVAQPFEMAGGALQALALRGLADAAVSYQHAVSDLAMLAALVVAAFRERATLFGVQQALGPYGHAIDHRVAGYVRPGETGDGFRIPNRLAIWGGIHADTISR